MTRRLILKYENPRSDRESLFLIKDGDAYPLLCPLKTHPHNDAYCTELCAWFETRWNEAAVDGPRWEVYCLRLHHGRLLGGMLGVLIQENQI